MRKYHTRKSFQKYLISEPNDKLLETMKYSSWYSKSDIDKVRSEIARRKRLGLMRKNAGMKRNIPTPTGTRSGRLVGLKDIISKDLRNMWK